MVDYLLEDVPEDVWYGWANGIPRDENLDDRLVELILEDVEARDG